MAPARSVPRTIGLTVAPGSARIAHIPAVAPMRVARVTAGPCRRTATAAVAPDPVRTDSSTTTAAGVLPAGGPAARRRVGFGVTADGAYGACLATVSGMDGADGPDGAGGGWMVERWTLDAAEPYVVPLPGGRPEEPGTGVAPLADGRVLVLRAVADRYDAVLLYPAGPGTGETHIASLSGGPVRLLPPSPAGDAAHVLLGRGGTTEVWQVVGAPGGEPSLVMTIDGRCSGGVWLDRAGRLLALDRALDGRTKTVAADLRTGTTTLLLHITDDSDDLLVLAEPDSGLLVLRSDAPGRMRLGWGVLGSSRPVRFPDALCPPGPRVTPVAVQPGQILMPESAVVALHAQAPDGSESLALWRPGERHVHWRPAPAGWLGGAGLWDCAGLRLPYAGTECGFAVYAPPAPDPAPARVPGPVPRPVRGLAPEAVPHPGFGPGPNSVPAAPRPRVVKEPGRPRPARRALAVLPLQQAPLSATRA